MVCVYDTYFLSLEYFQRTEHIQILFILLHSYPMHMMTGLDKCDSSSYLGSPFIYTYMHHEKRENCKCGLKVTQTCFSEQLGLLLQGCPNSMGGDKPLYQGSHLLPPHPRHEMTNDLKFLDVLIIFSVQLSNL